MPTLVNERHERFAQELAKGTPQAEAYAKAGYHPNKSAASKAADRTDVRARVAELLQRGADRAEVTVEKIVTRWWEIANADPNDLIQFRRTCCRYCHGEDHRYQWRDAEEFAEALAAAEKVAAKELPSDAGGHGFNPTLDPDPDCPRCFGEGVGEVHASDTRKLTEAARALYAGVKVTRDGFEVKMQDQGKALENIARHLGMFKDRVEHSGGVSVNITGRDADL